METISTDELATHKAENDVILVDVLSREHFEDSHIPGAINIPMDHVAEKAPDLFTKNQKIVVYCADTECGASVQAAETLEEHGFEHVMDYEAGKDGWESAGHHLE
ncbi:MAG: rhodanese-like domain-containing protein [Candidatus Nanohaloarchaea archaeon]|nr:rhodanese-like domain-containing protein [Candidatus Nanohaloarchaea archaeon]